MSPAEGCTADWRSFRNAHATAALKPCHGAGLRENKQAGVPQRNVATPRCSTPNDAAPACGTASCTTAAQARAACALRSGTAVKRPALLAAALKVARAKLGYAAGQ
jgi:hypothetical protein